MCLVCWCCLFMCVQQRIRREGSWLERSPRTTKTNDHGTYKSAQKSDAMCNQQGWRSGPGVASICLLVHAWVRPSNRSTLFDTITAATISVNPPGRCSLDEEQVPALGPSLEPNVLGARPTCILSEVEPALRAEAPCTANHRQASAQHTLPGWLDCRVQ